MESFDKKLITPFLPVEATKASKYVQSDYKLLIHFHIISLFSTGFFFVYCQYMGFTKTSWAVLISFFTAIIGLYLLKKLNYMRLVAHFFTLSFFLTFFLANLFAGLGVNPAMVWFILFPLVPVSILGIKEGVIWTIFSSVIYIGATILTNTYNINLTEITGELALHSGLTNMFFGPLIVYVLSAFAYRNKDSAIEDLEKINLELEKLNKEKQYLMSVLFHDLSNSVHVCLNFSDPVFSKNAAEEKMQKCLARIQTVSKNMDNLIAHVRELQAVESGKKKIELGNVALSDIFKQIKVMFDKKLEEKNIKLEIHTEVDNLSVKVEEVSFSNSVINNLISNAIKFSPENETINIWVRDFDEKVEIRIEDFGGGIPEELLPHLFDFNKPSSRKGTKGESGTGFGLPTVKKYMDMFQGTITYEYALPDQKKGSQFKLLVPRAS